MAKKNQAQKDIDHLNPIFHSHTRFALALGREMPLLPADRALGTVEQHLFAQNREVRFVRRQTEHDQVSVETVQDVFDVGRPAVLCSEGGGVRVRVRKRVGG